MVKKSISRDFTDPITGITERMNVHAEYSEEHVHDLKMYGIDPDAMIESTLQKEMNYQCDARYIDAVMNDAQKNSDKMDIDVNHYPDIWAFEEQVLRLIMKFAYRGIYNRFRFPQIVVTPYVGICFRDFRRFEKEEIEQNRSHFSKIGTISYEDPDQPTLSNPQTITVPVMQNDFALWDDRWILIYDFEDPRKNALITEN